MTKRYVFMFEEGRADQRHLLGGKGANLAEMTFIGLPVPPGFTITTEACNDYYARDRQMAPSLATEVAQALKRLEERTGKVFGGDLNPLLVSVRSGAPVSMPGMMDTILNLGLNDQTVLAHAQNTQNERFAWDCYRRFIQMFANVVLEMEGNHFEQILSAVKQAAGIEADPDLQPEHLREVVQRYKDLIRKRTGQEFPQDPQQQLALAIGAVFNSWGNPRAVFYRKMERIPDQLGTAVNIQAMAFGNMGPDSGTGVVFTRNPNTGVKEFYGEYLINAQGEDVVAGIRTPLPISRLKEELPEAYEQLFQTCELLEQHYADMQDIEFTIERNKLYMLQCRAGKRTPRAAIQIAVDLVAEGRISREQALLRVDPGQVEKLLHRAIDPNAQIDVLATGLPASPGAASGIAVFDPDRAEKLGAEGRKVILVRPETAPDDIAGIVAAQGILTTRGGMTCHAAIVARGMGKPCIVGAESIHLDVEQGILRTGGREAREFDLISIDGTTGNVIVGEVPMVDPELSPAFVQLLEWADELRTMEVRANADSPEDAAKAREFGAQGVGLCRTEHMFGQGGHHPERMVAAQQMILAETLEDRQSALAQLQEMQREDFAGLFRAMQPYPVTIRLLDPPLHEFLPPEEDLAIEVGILKATGGDRALLFEKESLLRKVRQMSEINPMLGFRGVRLGVIYPEIYEMQVRAIFEAAILVNREGAAVEPEIMIPLVGHVNELRLMKEMVDRVGGELAVTFPYHVGTMIEVPRAALTAGEIAAQADFFSFGTNDLTQTTFGYSRDDAEGKFLAAYVQQKVLPENPFVSIDQQGVGSLVRTAVEQGKQAHPDIQLGICGEHGGDPASIEFFHQVGLHYVSCSPFRVPVARLAAAQAAVRERGVLVEKDV